MIVKGYGMMQITRMQIYPVLQFSVSYAYLAILIGGILMIYYQIPIFWKQIGVFRGK
jgi:TRAP-type C4-dicarboxylate transport system permease small subunit